MLESTFCAVVILVIALLYHLKMPWFLKLTSAYFLLTTAYTALDPFYRPMPSMMMNYQLAVSAAKCFVLMVALPAVALLPMKIWRKITWFMMFVFIFDCGRILWGKSGLMDVPTFDCAIMACFIMTLDYKDWVHRAVIVLFLAAIVYSRGRDAGLIVGVNVLTLWLINFYKSFRLRVFVAITGGMALIGAGLSFWYLPRFLGEARVLMWKTFADWWQANVNHWIGAGTGSFELFGPTIPVMDGTAQHNMGYYVMHNDWLQIIFENGWIGFSLILISYLWVAKWLRNDKLAMWLGIGAGMIFYFPTHAFPVQILIAFLVVDAIRNWQNRPVRMMYY